MRKFNSHRKFKRKTFKGNWICAECGKQITELPFLPSPERAVYCRECWMKRNTKE